MSVSDPSWQAPQWLLAGLNLSALALLVVVAWAWARHQGRARLVTSAAIAVAAVTLLYLLAVGRHAIPLEWITILHHGLGRKMIMHLYGRGAHVGSNFPFVIDVIASGSFPTLRDVAWFNALLGLVNALLFLHLAIRIVGPTWAVPWTLVFALNPATFFASFSELPTNLIGLYTLAGFIAWAVVVDTLPQPAWARAAGYALCAVLTTLVGLTRAEVGGIGIVALSVGALHAVVGAERWAAAMQRLRSAGEWVLAVLSAHLALVVAACVIGAVLSVSGIPALIGRQQVAGVYPFNPSFLALFVYLPMLLLPIGVSIAVFFGFVHTTVHFVRFGGLALSLFVLVRAYFSAQYEYFEMGRYMSYILPGVFLVGLFGHWELMRLARGWSPNWVRAVRVGYVMAWCTLPLPGIVEFYARPDFRLDGGFAQIFPAMDTQREVRHLVELTEGNPQCVYVGRVVMDQGDPKVDPHYAYVMFGAPVAEPIIAPEQGAPLDAFIAANAPGASCVRLYYGNDCNVTFGDRCQAFVAGRRLVDEQRFWARPYNNPRQSGYAAPELVLATYAWP